VKPSADPRDVTLVDAPPEAEPTLARLMQLYAYDFSEFMGWNVGEDTVIASGLQPGQRVVTDGQLRLTPGAKVDIKSGS